MNTAYHPFPVTRWTMVDQAATISSDAGFQALEKLLLRYRPALKAHLVYVKKVSREQADDYIQSFIAGKILQSEILRHADKEKGKFRTFLLTAFDRFIKNEIEKQQAKKRSPAGGFAPLDEAMDATNFDSGSSVMMDLVWAQEIINQAIQEVHAECRQSNREHFWKIFDARIIQPIMQGGKPVGYEELLKSTGFESPMQASNALITTKRIFVRTIKKIIGQYAENDEDIQQELDELRRVLAGVI
jgi:DNA-directed RNA polymerase specialized sigma24 family protein